MNLTLNERFRGALLGLATGDAVGTTVEFMPPGTFPPVTDMVGGGAFHLQAGQWTDDTAMALCLAESSRTTHGARTCLDACRYFGGLLVAACAGVDKDLLLSDRYSPVAGIWAEDPLCPEIGEVASGSFKHKEPPEIVGSGYVVRCLEAALWAFFHSSDFREGCLLAANLGDDADTTAAVYGQLAGAYYGEQGIPPEWRDRLAMADQIIVFAEGLARGG